MPTKYAPLLAIIWVLTPNGVVDEAHFRDDLGIDWLGRLELMILMEDKFPGVEITNKDANEIEVVGDLIRYVENNGTERRWSGGLFAR